MTALIQSSDALAPHLERWARCAWLSVDTEFVRVDTYYPKLCLIQVGDGVHSLCIDTLAFDFAPLLDRLYQNDCVKVLHAASQDLEILVQLRGRCPTPLFDSQIAATLLGIGDQIGYAGLIEKRLGIALDKSLSRTDWARRPLREAELAYAAADVEHLARIYPALQDELDACGRLVWLAEDCARLSEADAYRTQPEDAWQRLRGLSRLTPEAQTVAVVLAAWREVLAQQRDRPRKWILEDDAIYRIAERRPDSLAQLSALNVLPPKTLERHGDALLEQVALAREQPVRRYAEDEELSSDQKQQLKELQSRVQARASELRLPPGYLASRTQLLALLRQGAQATVPIVMGWRREVCGGELLKML